MTENKIVPFERAELEHVPSRDEQLKLLRTAAGAGQLTNEEFGLLIEIARRQGLDIMARQVFGVKYGGKFTVVVSIDGRRAIARRSGLAGIDDAAFTYADADEKKNFPLAATITVYRWGPRGEKESYTATARFREYAQMDRDGKPTGNWRQRPHVMLAKCAEALALRKAFPESLAGMYEEAELDLGGGVSVQRTGAKQLDDVIAKRQRVEETTHDVVTGEVVDEPPPWDFDPSDREAP